MAFHSESQPFLESKDLEYGNRRHATENQLCHGCRRPSKALTLKTGLVHLFILLSYTMIFLGYHWRQTAGSKLLYDTIHDLDIRIKPTSYVVAGASPYSGRPSPEVDRTWHELLGNTTIRVTADELSRNGDRQESIALPEGGGQMVWLGAFHQLHCLKKLRRLNYPQTYAANRTEAEALDEEVHINHCVELLRQSIMCNPDISLTTFTWSSSSPKPVLRVGGYERNCVDWETFMSGILPRVVSSQEMDSLVNPKLV